MDPQDLWIIRKVGLDPKAQRSVRPAEGIGLRQEFEVSDFGRALMLHLPHYVWAPLVGFEAVRKVKARRWFARSRTGEQKSGERQSVRYQEAELFKDLDFSEYPDLTDYIRKFRTALIRKSRVLEELDGLDPASIEDLQGLYSAADGSLQTLTLAGTFQQKRQYIQEHFGQVVEIQVDPSGSYESNITLRLDGRQLRSYFGRNSYRMEAILRDDNQFEIQVSKRRKRLFRMVNAEIINRLFMLQHAVDLNEEFRKALAEIVTGDLLPLKLTVKSFHIGQAFDQLNAPLSLEREFESLRLSPVDRKRVVRQLTGRVVLCIVTAQSAVVGGPSEVRSVGAVLHSMAGMASVEREFPGLVESVRERSTSSQIGEFYLFSGFSSATEPGSGRENSQAGA